MHLINSKICLCAILIFNSLCPESTNTKDSRSNGMKKNKESARKLGESIGAKAIQANIKEVIFDRGPYKYHGILAELADGARQAGLKF